MRPKILSKQTLLMISFSGLIFSATLFIVYFLPQNSIQGSSALLPPAGGENAAVNLSPEQTNIELPVRLKIPSINVDTSFEYVGLTSDGAMDVPESPHEVAWFNIGPRPGGKGSAVIAGHKGWKNNIPAVFDDLYKLRKGDKIYIEDEKGTLTVFTVRESRIYDPESDAGEVFSSNDGNSHLNLITCEGDWDEEQKSYSTRLVVFTDKDSE